MKKIIEEVNNNYTATFINTTEAPDKIIPLNHFECKVDYNGRLIVAERLYEFHYYLRDNQNVPCTTYFVYRWLPVIVKPGREKAFIAICDLNSGIEELLVD